MIILHMYKALGDHSWYIGVIDNGEFEYATLEAFRSSVDDEFFDYRIK